MMKKLSLVIFGAGLLGAAFAPERWLYRQKVEVAGAVTRVTLDPGFYSGADANLADLRVVRDGVEVPFLLRVARGTRDEEELAVRVVNKEMQGGSLSVTLEFVRKDVLHNELNLAFSRKEFRSQVDIEGSDDGRSWGWVRRGAYIFHYATERVGAATQTTLRYPDSRRRFLRLTMSGWPDASQFTGARVWSDASAEARRRVLWSTVRPKYETKERKTCMVLDTGLAAPVDTLQVTVAAGRDEFYRQLTLEAREARAWVVRNSGAIYRLPGEELLSLRLFPERRAPRLRLCVFQGDDEPVLLESVTLLGIDRDVAFRSEEAGSYWLYWGASSARPPEYDLAKTAGKEFWSLAKAGKLGTREANPGYRPPPEPVKPWTERFPGLLYGVMGVAVVGIVWMALRLLKT